MTEIKDYKLAYKRIIKSLLRGTVTGSYILSFRLDKPPSYIDPNPYTHTKALELVEEWSNYFDTETRGKA